MCRPPGASQVEIIQASLRRKADELATVVDALREVVDVHDRPGKGGWDSYYRRGEAWEKARSLVGEYAPPSVRGSWPKEWALPGDPA